MASSPDRTARGGAVERCARFLAVVCAVAVGVRTLDAQRPRGGRNPGRAAPQDPTPAPPPALGEAATRAVAARFQESKHWVQRSVTLLSLNHYWHPAGVEIVLEALASSDRRLRAYGVETLLRAENGLLPSLATAELVDALVTRGLSDSNEHFRGRVTAALQRLAPASGATTRSQWRTFWGKAKKEWRPKPWVAKAVPEPKKRRGGATVTQTFAARAFDLYQNGLDVVICIDSTGSMQATIDTARDAIGEMLAILEGISPRLRMGLVHYKDFGDMKAGAKLLVALSANVKGVRSKLGKLVAGGGGDAPERVAEGLEIAVSRKMRWQASANKLVILIGDAPPQDLAKAVAMAKRGYENPGGRKGPTTGPRKSTLRPIITSAIAVNGGSAGTFPAIAKAGRGAFAQIQIAPMPRSRRKDRGKPNPAAGRATREIVEHILTLSFGEGFRTQMRAFVSIFYDYRAAGFFK